VLSAKLNAQRYCDILETVLPGLLEDVPLAVRQRLWFRHDVAPSHYGDDVQQWLKATCTRKMNWTWRPDCMASSIAGPNSNGFFPRGDM
jgi:hypothetical protein